jgi:pilus assembly protein CpaB
MNRRVLILLLLLVVLGGGLAVLLLSGGLPGTTPAPAGGDASLQETLSAYQTKESAPIATPLRFTKVVIAIQNLPRGITIPENGVQTVEWPLERFPTFGIGEIRDVVGKIARTDISRGAPVLETQLIEDVLRFDLTSIGSDAAAVLPENKVAIAVPIDRLTNVAGAPKTGDRVDVIISFLFVDIDEEFQSIKPNKIILTTVGQDGTVTLSTAIDGRVEPSGDFSNPVIVSPRERQRPRLVTQRTIQNALVVNVGNFTADGDFLGRRPSPTPLPPPTDQPSPTPVPQIATPTLATYDPDIIVLAVDPQDAVTLAFVTEAGLPVILALRSAKDREKPPTDTTAVTLEYILNTYQITQPPRLPYGLEPRIKSIRRLVTENTVPLDEGP